LSGSVKRERKEAEEKESGGNFTKLTLYEEKGKKERRED